MAMYARDTAEAAKWGGYVLDDLDEREPNAVELTVDHAWFIAETIGAGSFPWVLAITTPYCDAAQRNAFLQRQKATS